MKNQRKKKNRTGKKLFQLPFMVRTVFFLARLLFAAMLHRAALKIQPHERPATVTGVIGRADSPARLHVGITPHLLVQCAVILLSALSMLAAGAICLREYRKL